MNIKTNISIIIALLLIIILSGCINNIGQIALSPGEIKNHPNKYLGQTITVEGYYSGGAIWETKTPGSEEEAANAIVNALMIENHDENITVYEGGKYRFTGILKEKTMFSVVIIYLEATKIIPV